MLNGGAGKLPYFRGITRFRYLIALIALSFAGGLGLLVYGAPPAGAQAVTDYDTDQDGLIEVGTLAQLNAIRWDLNGNGNPDLADYIDGYNAAFPNRDNTAEGLMGCPDAACTGYELTANLDFDTDGDNDVDADDAYPNWVPIPTYRATFDGNGHTITRLTINTDARFAGLFGIVARRVIGGIYVWQAGGIIRNVGMVDADVSGGGNFGGVGILAGRNRGTIRTSYIQGGSVTVASDNSAVGGLAGVNSGTISIAYSTASVNGGNRNHALIGGLAGINNAGRITESYAAGPVSGATTTARAGGLAGQARWTFGIDDSYCDITATMQTTCIGSEYKVRGRISGSTATSTSALQSPTSYTGIYKDWTGHYYAGSKPALDVFWNFGTASQYPTLKYEVRTPTNYDVDNDGLIEVSTLAQLNAIRWDLDGNGQVDARGINARRYRLAFPGHDLYRGGHICPEIRCTGYELIADLDFDTDGDNDVDANDAYPNWTPIGIAITGDFDCGGIQCTVYSSYVSDFNGNGHTIIRLTSNTTEFNTSGLFGILGDGGSIRNVGMVDASVRGGGESVGILVGHNYGTITTSYARGGSVSVNATSTRASTDMGGLVGINDGPWSVIEASYSTASVNGGSEGSVNIGGLVGRDDYGAIIASYAAGALSGAATTAVAIGGLVGRASDGSFIANSYYDTGASGQSQGVGAQASGVSVTAAGYSSSTLQTPTGYTGIYAQWNIDLDGDGDGLGDDPWNFGTSGDYPTPKVVRVTKPEPELPRRISPTPVVSSIESDDPAPEASLPEPGNSGASDQPGEPVEEVYDPETAHPEVYANDRYRMSASCEVDGDGAVISFDLGSYAGPVALWLSLWDGEVFASYAAQGVAAPALEREGRTGRVRVATNPAQTRFRLDGGSPPRNLLLGYADCHSDGT